jgi:hypothetical protein
MNYYAWVGGPHLAWARNTLFKTTIFVGLVLAHTEVFKRSVGGEHSAGKKKLTQ